MLSLLSYSPHKKINCHKLSTQSNPDPGKKISRIFFEKDK